MEKYQIYLNFYIFITTALYLNTFLFNFSKKYFNIIVSCIITLLINEMISFFNSDLVNIYLKNSFMLFLSHLILLTIHGIAIELNLLKIDEYEYKPKRPILNIKFYIFFVFTNILIYFMFSNYESPLIDKISFNEILLLSIFYSICLSIISICWPKFIFCIFLLFTFTIKGSYIIFIVFTFFILSSYYFSFIIYMKKKRLQGHLWSFLKVFLSLFKPDIF